MNQLCDDDDFAKTMPLKSDTTPLMPSKIKIIIPVNNIDDDLYSQKI